jgi:hypothetical protein
MRMTRCGDSVRRQIIKSVQAHQALVGHDAVVGPGFLGRQVKAIGPAGLISTVDTSPAETFRSGR